MLTLTRKVGETIQIGPDISVTVKEIRRKHVRLGVRAPKEIPVHRLEVWLEIEAEKEVEQ